MLPARRLAESALAPALPRAPLPCAGAAPLPSNDGKKWAPEEVAELLLLVEDDGYRRQRLGLDKVRMGPRAGRGEWDGV